MTKLTIFAIYSISGIRETLIQAFPDHWNTYSRLCCGMNTGFSSTVWSVHFNTNKMFEDVGQWFYLWLKTEISLQKIIRKNITDYSARTQNM